MPAASVRMILGGPGRKVPFYGIVGVKKEFEYWEEQGSAISVLFDDRDQVTMKDWHDISLRVRLRRWLGL
jgi:hypothetical protein